jgi:transketolase
MVPEAMRAAWILKEEYAIETRIVNVHTVKPLDVATLVEAADETRVLLTAEEHQGWGLREYRCRRNPAEPQNFRQSLQLDMVGVADCFGISGNPSELMQHFGLTAEHIAKRVLDLLDKKLATYQSLDLCAACRIERGKVTRNSTYVCLACRAKPVLR